jgi:hypothetical protein
MTNLCSEISNVRRLTSKTEVSSVYLWDTYLYQRWSVNLVLRHCLKFAIPFSVPLVHNQISFKASCCRILITLLATYNAIRSCRWSLEDCLKN